MSDNTCMDTKTEVKKPGRPPLPTDKVLSKCIEFRCTEKQYAEYVKRGAQEAVRAWLDNDRVEGPARPLAQVPSHDGLGGGLREGE